MTDQIDLAQKQERLITEAAIANSRIEEIQLPKGRCNYCREIIEPILMFCDDDCRDDYKQEQHIKKINGLL